VRCSFVKKARWTSGGNDGEALVVDETSWSCDADLNILTPSVAGRLQSSDATAFLAIYADALSFSGLDLGERFVLPALAHPYSAHFDWGRHTRS